MVLRQALVAASRSGVLRRLAEEWGPARCVADRFVAGETLDEAVGVARRLQEQGMSVSLDELGEAVGEEATARRHAEASRAILDRIDGEGLDGSLSVKPTALGIDVSEGLCRELTADLCRRAADVGTHVTLDMESSAYTQRTVDLVVALREQGHDNVGCALQAYLHRTLDDVRRLTRMGVSVRVCKGAYAEPEDIALQDREAIADAFVRAAAIVLEGGARGRFATHDHRVIGRIRALASERGVGRGRYEFQMLYGVREPLQQRLVAAGHDLRVYVPFGPEWYPYLTRRLAERPANLVFFLRALTGGRASDSVRVDTASRQEA